MTTKDALTTVTSPPTTNFTCRQHEHTTSKAESAMQEDPRTAQQPTLNSSPTVLKARDIHYSCTVHNTMQSPSLVSPGRVRVYH